MRLVGPKGWLLQGWAQLDLIPGTGGATTLAARAPAEYWRAIAEQPRYDAADCVRLGIGEAVADPVRCAVDRAAALAKLTREVLAGYAEFGRARTLPTDDDLLRCADVQSRLLTSARFGRLAAERLAGR
jgi:enoyl-CoA hydratase/carnithine racemase